MQTQVARPVTERAHDGSWMNAGRALWAVIGISTVMRLIWATTLGAAVDEPYYFQYLQHFDWSYFDHPPMVAIVSAPAWRFRETRTPCSGCGSVSLRCSPGRPG